MAASEIDWQQIFIWAGMATGGGVAAFWVGLRKPKEDTGNPVGVAHVVSASFVDKVALEQNTVATEANTVALIELNQHMRTAEQERHDVKIAREAAAEALLMEKLRRTDCGPDSVPSSSWRPER